MALPSPHLAMLAIDTSTQEMSVALHAHGRPHYWQGAGGAQASKVLLRQIAQLLAQAALPMQGLQAIAVGVGPGAFTGLRTACAVAQGLALGAGVPVVPVDSLMLVAEAAWIGQGRSLDGEEVGVVMDARMGELYAARYRRHALGWDVTGEPALCDPQDLCGRWGGWPRALAGSGVHLLQGLKEEMVWDAPERAKALLSLAQWRFAQGHAVEPEHALPIYLRDKVALTTAQREALLAHGGANPHITPPRPMGPVS